MTDLLPLFISGALVCRWLCVAVRSATPSSNYFSPAPTHLLVQFQIVSNRPLCGEFLLDATASGGTHLIPQWRQPD